MNYFDSGFLWTERSEFTKHFSKTANDAILKKLSTPGRQGCLTKRFRVAVCLSSDEPTSKYGKNKNVAHEASWVCYWSSYNILASSVIYYMKCKHP